MSAAEPQLWRIDKTWRPHRSVMLASVQRIESGLWAHIGQGARVVSHDHRMTTFPTEAAVYFPSDNWWSAIFMPGASPDLHIDIGTPYSVKGDEIRTTDLDLDIVRQGGEVSVLDRDEFDVHRITHAYPPETTSSANGALTLALNLIRTRQFPFDDTDVLERFR